MFLVTGANGFIGSQIATDLVANGSEVVVYHSSPISLRLAPIADKLKFVSGDLIEWEALLGAVRQYKIQTIVHLAYYRDIVEQERMPLKATRINCLGFNNLLEVARLGGVKRVVWCSSVAVYGPPEIYTEPVNEDAPCQPGSLYGACKVYNEHLANLYQRQFGLETIGLRPAIVYGPGRWFSGQASFARDLFVNAVTGRATLLEAGDMPVNWVYVRDVSQAFVKACFVDAPRHNIFNLEGAWATIRQAGELVQELVPAAKIEIRGGGKQTGPRVDWTRAREELGYVPAFGLKQGITECLESLKRELKDPE